MKALAVILMSVMLASCTKEDITPVSERVEGTVPPAPNQKITTIAPSGDIIVVRWVDLSVPTSPQLHTADSVIFARK